MTIYAIKDTFHPAINGKGNAPEVRSDQPEFKTPVEFFDWVRQHHANMEDVYVIEGSSTVNGVKLSPWTVWYDIETEQPEEGYCCFRFIEGTDPNVVANRVAFIEKTPRIRTVPYNPAKNECDDWVNWQQGYKGCGGADGHIPANELYGYYPPSRRWCDEQLKKLGYILG